LSRHLRRHTIGLSVSILVTLGLLSADARAAATLYAITGDGATVKETLYTLSQSNGAATFVKTLGNGTGGEALGYNPADGLLYHFSGESVLDVVPPQLNNPATGSVMETINPSTLAINPITIQGSAASRTTPQSATSSSPPATTSTP
jgi:hypothetical protein